MTPIARTALRRWDAFGIVSELARAWGDVEAATNIARLDREALADLLAMARRATLLKAAR